jgi:DHA1 family bicyclomycin/chloramphenicol resistance-like MFS transporter
MAIAGIINARIVVRLGMRYVSHRALVAFLVVAVAMAILSLGYDGRPPFWLLWVGLWIQFFFFGLIVSNFNALAMEPLGHVAGTASSMMGSYTTLCGGLFGALIGQSFDMTALPMNVGFSVFSLAAFIIVLMTERGNVFRR